MVDNGLALGVLEQSGEGNSRAMRGRSTETRRSLFTMSAMRMCCRPLRGSRDERRSRAGSGFTLLFEPFLLFVSEQTPVT
jgi:hypothetical protein